MLKTQRKAEWNGAGFTLIEVVITIVVTAIIAGIAAMILVLGMRSYSDEYNRGNVRYQARYAVERMTREIRLIRSCADIVAPANPSAVLSFTDISGNALTFSVAGGNLTRNGDLLAAGVTTPQPFRFLDQAGNPTASCVAPNDIQYVEINLTAVQGSETFSLRTRVYPRNF